jgi:hypothetical protein
MKYNAEQVAFMLHEAIDQNSEYKSWHCSTQHLMALVARVVAEEREACAKIVEEHAKVYAKLEKNPATSAAWAACIDIHDSISERGEA